MALGAFPPAPGGSAPEGPAPPNILVVVTDDQRFPLPEEVMGATWRLFVEQGVSFPRAFVTTPFCCPSRATIMTGRYAHNHGVRSNQDGEPDNLDQATTVQRTLKEAGYRTAIFGKYLNGWDLSRNPPSFDTWATFSRGAPNGYFDLPFNVNGTVRTIQRYSTDYIAARAVRFLEARASRTRPWFLYLAPWAPHNPWIPEPQYQNAVVPGFRQTPDVLEEDLSDKPRYVQRARRYTVLPSLRARHRRQLQTLMSVDDLVAEVFRSLRRTGESRNTLAFFISDNGLLLGEHGLVGKAVPYTRSVRVPFAMRWPRRVAAGAVDDRLVANVDIAPTILDAAGITPEAPMDGRSLLDPTWRRDRVLLEQWASENSPAPTWASLRGLDYQYVEYYRQDGRILEVREYYDLDSDPWQLLNLLGDDDPSNDPPEAAALSARLALDRACQGPESCP